MFPLCTIGRNRKINGNPVLFELAKRFQEQYRSKETIQKITETLATKVPVATLQ